MFENSFKFELPDCSRCCNPPRSGRKACVAFERRLIVLSIKREKM
jgi:hypothetical protein